MANFAYAIVCKLGLADVKNVKDLYRHEHRNAKVVEETGELSTVSIDGVELDTRMRGCS